MALLSIEGVAGLRDDDAMWMLLFLLLSPAQALTRGEELLLAQRYAPTLWQGLGPRPAADEFTRVDFDGDWRADNNWDNLERFPRPPAVYYAVLESTKFLYLTYALFFPRDYAAFCFWMHCHENDFEGMRVTVEKASERVVRLEGLAHNRMSAHPDPADISFTVEAQGHGVHPRALRAPDERHRRYAPGEYALVSLDELWQRRDTPLFRSHFDYRGRRYPAAFAGGKWIVFGWGAAKPPWAWEVWNADWEKGEWFLDPAKGAEDFLHHPFR